MNLTIHRHAGHWVCGVTVCIVMLVTSEQSGAEMPPVRVWGELGYDFRQENFENGNDALENAIITRLNGSTYLYQPWVATIEGGIGLDLRRTERDTVDTSSNNVTGYGRLRLFPQSRFPFEAFADVTDSRSDSDLAGLDVERTRVGFIQRYTSTRGDAYKLRYEHTKHLNDSRSSAGTSVVREDVADLVQASYNKSFNAHNIYFDSQLNVVDRVDSPDRNKTMFTSLRHTYTPGPTLSAEDMLTYNVTDLQQALTDIRTGVLQLHSIGFWRPRTDRPLRINATLRALDRTTESGGVDSSLQSATGTIGATYQWTPRWLFSGSAGATDVESDAGGEVQTFQTASANYTSEQINLGGFDAGWFAQADIRNNTDDQGSLQSYGTQAGYSLQKNMMPGRASALLFNASQSAALITESDGFNSQRLLSRLSLTWRNRDALITKMVRASLSDTRTYAGGTRADEVAGEFQLANLQASLDQRLTTTSTFSGNLTIQATRDAADNPVASMNTRNGEWC
ncbi:MAG: hypothetical protein OEY45_01905, partial [Gammaproteobacteria bacterium]|nr:hypothetical protein [Gammaproteobacteria bacterium]